MLGVVEMVVTVVEMVGVVGDGVVVEAIGEGAPVGHEHLLDGPYLAIPPPTAGGEVAHLGEAVGRQGEAVRGSGRQWEAVGGSGR